LRIVQADAHDDCFRPFSFVRDVLLGSADPHAPFGGVFERPRSIAQMTKPPSTASTWPVM
jgi:hypothetical protein